MATTNGQVLNARGIAHNDVDIADYDITDAQATADYMETFAPIAVIFCSAYSAVDKAEEVIDLA